MKPPSPSIKAYGGDDTELHLVPDKIRRGLHFLCKLLRRYQFFVVRHSLLCGTSDGACGKSHEGDIHEKLPDVTFD